MHTIAAQFDEKNYPIYVGTQLFSQATLWAQHIHGSQVLVVTQQPLADFYLAKLQTMLAAYQCDTVLLAQGEENKNLTEWQKIFTALLQKKHERSTTLIALGGGMVGDMTGFAAACYQRGVNYIQVPTSLVAQVDSAIGAKTAINHPLGKNMLGVFYPPQSVFVDLDTLHTLPEREFIAGLAEVIKYALIADQEFFNWLETNMALVLRKDYSALLHVVTTCIHLKKNLVAHDEQDQGVRQLLNFGHTFGHALEAATHYQSWLHGEAVAMGMSIAAHVSVAQGWLSTADLNRIHQLLHAAGLLMPRSTLPTAAELLTWMRRDKKVAQGQMTLILLKGIGHAEKTSIANEEAIREMYVGWITVQKAST